MIRNVGNSQSSEIARRQNANEQRQLERKISRFNEEYKKTMKYFLEERQCAREAMRELRRELLQCRSHQPLIFHVREMDEKMKFTHSQHPHSLSDNNVLKNPSTPTASHKIIRFQRSMSVPSSTTNLEQVCRSQKFRPLSCRDRSTTIGDNRNTLHQRSLTTISDHVNHLPLEENSFMKVRKNRRRCASASQLELNRFESRDRKVSTVAKADSKKRVHDLLSHNVCSAIEQNFSCPRQKLTVAKNNETSLPQRNVTRNIESFLFEDMAKEGKGSHKSSRFRLSPSTGIAKVKQVNGTTIAAKTLISLHRREEAIKRATMKIDARKRASEMPKDEARTSQKNKFVTVANVIIAAKLFGDTALSENEN